MATNLDTGRAEYLEVPRRDAENTVLQATCALPLMFPVYHIDGRPCLDGGAADPIPYQRAFAQGCDRVMVVLTKPRDFVRKPEKLLPLIRRKYRQYPNFCRCMERRHIQYNESRARLFELERQGRVLIVAPESTLGVGRIEHNIEKLKLLWAQGYQAAVERMEEIRDYFGQ